MERHEKGFCQSEPVEDFTLGKWFDKLTMTNKSIISPLLVLSPTSRHALRLCNFKTVLNVVGDNTNNGKKRGLHAKGLLPMRCISVFITQRRSCQSEPVEDFTLGKWFGRLTMTILLCASASLREI
ncbi:MAG: hypothetical protein WC615_17725 [Mucilaginibacter sp.]|uniref:hypothetical protein n=1 Tax=Mucilaginibacter sp. TaxID=1882438 RepID=UPI003563A906